MSIFDNITGGKSQKTVAGAYKGFRDQVAASGAAAKGHLGEGYQNALSRYTPFQQYGQSGMEANKLYANALGINGAEDQQGAFNVFQDSPFLDYATGNNPYVLRDIDRNFNARGMSGSGANLLAQHRAAGEMSRNDVADFFNRLQGYGNQATGVGMQTAGAQAGLDYGYGGDMANLETNMGNALAQSHLGHANFEAANQNTGINNLMKLAGLGLQGYAAYNRIPQRAA